MKKKIVSTILVITTLMMAGCGEQAAVQTSESDSADSVSTETSGEATSESTEEGSSEASEKTAPASDTEYVYGTATLSYADFYAGDVSSTESFDAVSSATAKKYEIFPNMSTDFVDETTNAEGYKILGVKNVNVAVPADQVDEYTKINDSFVKAQETPSQYKVVTVENGEAKYSATNFNVVDTVTDAKAELLTGSNWGDYQLNIIESSTSYLRNSKEAEGFAISSDVQGAIIETKSGLKVGMEYLQSVWVQPYEISFNISADNTHNTRVKFDNLAELDKLEKEEIVSVTYINQNDAYVYNFDPVYVKPVYRNANVSGEVDENSAKMTLLGIPDGLENAGITVTYVVGHGKEAVRTQLFEGELSEEIALDKEALDGAKKDQSEEGSYTTVISSDNYANIAVTVE